MVTRPPVLVVTPYQSPTGSLPSQPVLSAQLSPSVALYNATSTSLSVAALLSTVGVGVAVAVAVAVGVGVGVGVAVGVDVASSSVAVQVGRLKLFTFQTRLALKGLKS